MSKKFGFKDSHVVFITVLLFTLALIPSCKTREKAAGPIVKDSRKTEDRTAPDLQQLIQDNAFKPSTINARAAVKTSGGSLEGSFNITLRLKTDSAIWISVSPLLGIEVARALITRDSVKFIDRLNKKYALADFQFLSNLLNVNVDFDIVQGVLTGNFFAYRKNRFNSVYVEDSHYILSTLSKRKLKRSLEETDISKPVIQDVWVEDGTFRITRLAIEDLRAQKSLYTDYLDFRATGGGLFPFKSSTRVKGEQEVNLDIEYNRVVVNTPIEFPFNIPSGYARID
jgi:hypothetical protein